MATKGGTLSDPIPEKFVPLHPDILRYIRVAREKMAMHTDCAIIGLMHAAMDRIDKKRFDAMSEEEREVYEEDGLPPIDDHDVENVVSVYMHKRKSTITITD